MMIPNDNIQEMAAYQKDPFEDLATQDALTIIAVYAAQMDPEDCQEDIRRAADIIKRRPEFEGCKEGVLSRFNKYVNSMQVVDPQKALELAAGVLKNSQAKRSAFELAAEVAITGAGLSEEKRGILENVADKLHIDQELMQRTIDKVAG